MTQKNYEQILSEHYKEDPSWLDGYKKIDREEQLKNENRLMAVCGAICEFLFEAIIGIFVGL